MTSDVEIATVADPDFCRMSGACSHAPLAVRSIRQVIRQVRYEVCLASARMEQVSGDGCQGAFSQYPRQLSAAVGASKTVARARQGDLQR
jgi:hypothetical protein